MGWATLRGLGLCQFIALERCRFRKITILFSCACITEAFGIALRPPRSLYCKNSRGHTHTHTHTQTNYCNPRCTCAPRVNDMETSYCPIGVQIGGVPLYYTCALIILLVVIVISVSVGSWKMRGQSPTGTPGLLALPSSSSLR